MNIEVGNYYYSQDLAWSGIFLVIETGRDSTRCTAKFITFPNCDFKECSEICYSSNYGRTVREATVDEILWLDSCISLGRYINRPVDQIVNNFQIH